MEASWQRHLWDSTARVRRWPEMGGRAEGINLQSSPLRHYSFFPQSNKVPLSDPWVTLPEPHPSFRTMDVSNPKEKLGRAPQPLVPCNRWSGRAVSRGRGWKDPAWLCSGANSGTLHGSSGFHLHPLKLWKCRWRNEERSRSGITQTSPHWAGGEPSTPYTAPATGRPAAWSRQRASLILAATECTQGLPKDAQHRSGSGHGRHQLQTHLASLSSHANLPQFWPLWKQPLSHHLPLHQKNILVGQSRKQITKSKISTNLCGRRKSWLFLPLSEPALYPALPQSSSHLLPFIARERKSWSLGCFV